jgi:hypothetical protein
MRAVTGTRSGVFRRLGSLLHVDPLPAWLTGTLQKMQELHFRGTELMFTFVVISKIYNNITNGKNIGNIKRKLVLFTFFLYNLSLFLSSFYQIYYVIPV